MVGERPIPANRTPDDLARGPRTYTPRHLADKILTSRSALEGERKQVTVLFADIKSSMELQEGLDPEEWHRIMNRFFQILTDGVHRFEGTVNQYTGDGIMALFGAPIAHEDHAQRACYAALHLVEELRRYGEEFKRTHGLSFAVRMGLNSGEVVVGKIGDDLRMDYTAQGHTVGLAARMEQLADPGKIYLSEATSSLVEGFFALRDLGVFTIKGLRTPTRVYELEGIGLLRTRLDLSRMRGFSRFVGRADELAALEVALTEAGAGRERVVGIVAEPGVGKSRLCHELVQRARARGFVVHEAHCAAHGRMLPFLPVLELLRSFFGIGDRDSSDVARQKIAGALILADDALKDALPFMFEFLGVPDAERPASPTSPEARQQQLVSVIRRLLDMASRRGTTLLLVEDLHWIDGGSATVLEKVIECIPAHRILLLMNFRPEFQAEWRRRPFYGEIDLRPLDRQATDELLRDLLGDDPSLGGIVDLIRERTRGNPFFIEEVVRSLTDEGVLRRGNRHETVLTRPVTEIGIPGTVQAVLAARIDRLPDREKEVLQIASVVGKEFSEPILCMVLDTLEHRGVPAETPGIVGEERDLASLQDLVASAFLYEEALYPERVFAFRHPLTQEVASHSLLSERRQRVHAAVAQAIAAMYPEALDERAALLAHHWEHAGEPLRAARCHHRAAAWAGGVDAAGSLAHLRKILSLLERVPTSQETIALGIDARHSMLRVGPFVRLTVEEAARLFAEGQRLAEESGNQRGLAQLVSTYGYFQTFAGHADQGRAYLERAADLAQSVDDVALKLSVLLDEAQLCLWEGRLREGLRAIGEAYELVKREGTLDVFRIAVGLSGESFVFAQRGLLRSLCGQHDDAARDLEQAVALAEKQEAPEGLSLAYAFRGMGAWLRGEAGPTLADAHAALAIAERIGTPFLQIVAQTLLGAALLLHEQWQEARRVLESVSAAGSMFEMLRLPLLAEACLRNGQPDDAERLATEALASARAQGNRLMEAFSQRLLAETELGKEGARARDAVEAALQATRTLVEETGASILMPFVHLVSADLARLLGDEERRGRELREALRLFTEMGAAGHAERLAKQIGR